MSKERAHIKKSYAFAFTGIMLLACNQANAGSFQLHEQCVTYLGLAYSGTASSATDASTEYYNTAGLTELKNPQLVLSGIYYHGNIKLYDARGTNNTGFNAGGPSTSHPASNAIIPSMHFSTPITKRWSFGIGVNTPFGLNTRYDNGSVARYVATTSKIMTMDITPGLAFKFNDQLSLGGGLDVMYLKAQISSAIRFQPTFGEGYVKNYAHGWSYGYHLGILFKPSADTKMGLAYFSLFNPHLSGHVDTLNYPSTTPPTSLTSKVNLPDRVVYSVTHKYTDNWTAMVDVEWAHWSRVRELRINYNTNTSAVEIVNNKNAFRFSLGTEYKPNNKWIVRGGLAYDESPIRTQYRIARLPDSDRYWVAIGAKYYLNKWISFDAGYAHLFFKNCSIAEVGSVAPDNKKSLYGNYKSSADLVGVQLTWNFV